MRWPRRDLDAEAEPSRISSAIVEVVGERGYRQTDLNLVLARAGVDRGTFERHFASLEDCFCITYQGLATDFLAAAAAAFAAERTWRDRIRAIAYTMLDFLEAEPARAGFLFVEVLFAGERAQLIREKNIAVLYPFIDLGREELADPDSVPSGLAEVIVGGVYEGIRLQVCRHRDDPDAWAAIVPQLMYSVVEPYLGAEAALEELEILRPRRAVTAVPS
jgi:AcrR family transcriptional regulator